MMRMSIALVALAGLGLSACPPKNASQNEATPRDNGTTPATATPTDEAAAGDETAEGQMRIRYHWSGGLSTFEFYTLTLTDDGEQPTARFVMKPVKGERRSVEEELSREELDELLARFEAVGFTELEQKPRGMKIFDIGRTVITYDPPGAEPTELYEDPDTVTTGDLKKIKAWFDRRVKGYLEAVSRPEEKPAE